MYLHLTHKGGPAPLNANVTYTYTFAADPWCLRIPWKQRHAFDDMGAVEYADQEAFLDALLARSGVSYRCSAPGEYVFADEATQQLFAELLQETLGAARA